MGTETDPVLIADEIVYGLDWDHQPRDQWSLTDNDRLHSAIVRAIRDAYEHAAEVCDACNSSGLCSDPQECRCERLADAIRALKGGTE